MKCHPSARSNLLPLSPVIQSCPLAIYQLRVVLCGVSPMIWRRLLVRSDTNLAQLHQVLQATFGWGDYYLHEFRIHGKHLGSAGCSLAAADTDEGAEWRPRRDVPPMVSQIPTTTRQQGRLRLRIVPPDFSGLPVVGVEIAENADEGGDHQRALILTD